MKISLYLTLSIFILSGCLNENHSTSPDPKLPEIATLIDTNKTLWETSNIINYMFTYNATLSDCPSASPFPPVVITVVNGTISSVYIPAFGIFEETTSNYLTINGLFEKMVQEVNENPLVFSKSSTEKNLLPEFNAEFGYPIKYYVDKTNNNCDARSVNVSEFQ